MLQVIVFQDKDFILIAQHVLILSFVLSLFTVEESTQLFFQRTKEEGKMGGLK